MKKFGIAMALGMMTVLMAEATDAETPPAAGVDAPPAKPSTTQLLGDKGGKEDEAPPAAPGDDEVLDKAGFAKSDDQGLNYSLSFLARHGFTADNPAVDAAMGGDFSLLKAELAQKGIQGWEQALQLGEQAYGRAVDKQKAQQAEVGKVVTQVAEEFGVDWEAAVAHVGSSASPAEKAAINNLLSDPATARIAASFITGSFLNADGVERDPLVNAAGDNATAAAKPANGKLSRAEFTKEMAALRGKLGDSYINSPEAQALFARRA